MGDVLWPHNSLLNLLCAGSDLISISVASSLSCAQLIKDWNHTLRHSTMCEVVYGMSQVN